MLLLMTNDPVRIPYLIPFVRYSKLLLKKCPKIHKDFSKGSRDGAKCTILLLRISPGQKNLRHCTLIMTQLHFHPADVESILSGYASGTGTI